MHDFSTAKLNADATKQLLSHVRAVHDILMDEDEHRLADHQDTINEFTRGLSLIEEVLVPHMGQKPTTFAINLARATRDHIEVIAAQEKALAASREASRHLASMFVGISLDGSRIDLE